MNRDVILVIGEQVPVQILEPRILDGTSRRFERTAQHPARTATDQVSHVRGGHSLTTLQR